MHNLYIPIRWLRGYSIVQVVQNRYYPLPVSESCAEIKYACKTGDEGPVMFGIETLDGPARGVAQVGLVLVEALALYVVYGELTAAVGERITDAVRGT